MGYYDVYRLDVGLCATRDSRRSPWGSSTMVGRCGVRALPGFQLLAWTRQPPTGCCRYCDWRCAALRVPQPGLWSRCRKCGAVLPAANVALRCSSASWQGSSWSPSLDDGGARCKCIMLSA